MDVKQIEALEYTSDSRRIGEFESQKWDSLEDFHTSGKTNSTTSPVRKKKKKTDTTILKAYHEDLGYQGQVRTFSLL